MKTFILPLSFLAAKVTREAKSKTIHILYEEQYI